MFLFVQVFNWLVRATHSRESGRQFALHSLLIQMLIFIQKHSHRHTPNNIGPNIWAPGPVNLTHKISHHRSPHTSVSFTSWSTTRSSQWILERNSFIVLAGGEKKYTFRNTLKHSVIFNKAYQRKERKKLYYESPVRWSFIRAYLT